MYHYVRPYDKELPYFKNLDFTDFQKQLDYFEKEFGFVNQEEFLDSFETGHAPKGVVLTFDDGLSCHHRYVYEELSKRKLWGIFYVSTGMYEINKILDVHRTHILLGKIKGEELFNVLKKIVDDNFLVDSHKKEFNLFTYTRQNNDDYTRDFKRILNYYIDYSKREKVIDSLIEYFQIPESELKVENFYLKHSEIIEMHKNRMIIGSHSSSHKLMSKLSIEDQEKEIISSFDYIERILGEKLKTKTFCYPYGGFHSFQPETEELLAKNGCKFSFNVEQRDIETKDLKFQSQALPRFDCNQFPFGKCKQ